MIREHFSLEKKVDTGEGWKISPAIWHKATAQFCNFHLYVLQLQ